MTIEVGKTALVIAPRVPMLTAPSGNVKMKDNSGALLLTSNALFFNEMAVARNARAGAQANLLNNTNRQTVIDIVSGVSGVLTHVVCAEASGVNTVTMFVTTDGVETEYINHVVPAGNRPVFGGVLPIDPQLVAATRGTSVLGAADSGWGLSTSIIGLVTPEEAIFHGIGIPFTDSLKVELQYSVGLSVSGNDETAGVTYVRS